MRGCRIFKQGMMDITDKISINEKKPYIGITGFMNKEEILMLTDCMPVSSKHLLMVGVLANQWTLQGFGDDNRHPRVEKIKDIFIYHPLTLNLIHYFTRHTDSIYQQLEELTELGGPNLHGFQFNFARPPIEQLNIYRSKYPNKILVLVVTEYAFKQVGYSPKLMTEKIAKYKGIIDYILLDRSGGFGIPLDTKFMLECLRELYNKELDMGLVVAGGLSSKTLYLIEPIIKIFPDIGIDAEDKLRNKDDTLNLNLAKDYLCDSLKIFKEKIVG